MRPRSYILPLLIMLLAVGRLFAGTVSSGSMVLVETWRIKPGNSRLPHDYWVNGVIKNISGHRMSDVHLVFAVETVGGKVLGESKAGVKLTTLLPDQECPFAAQVQVHDRRMYKMVLTKVTVTMVEDTVMLKAIPFSAQRTSFSFVGVRREDDGGGKAR